MTLEEKFRAAAAEAKEAIDTWVGVASKALKEAEKISEEYGIPFYSHISFLSQNYEPTTFRSKWKDLFKDEKKLEELLRNLGLSQNEYDSGWQHSPVCY